MWRGADRMWFFFFSSRRRHTRLQGDWSSDVSSSDPSRSREVENFYFLADYHALIKCQDPARVQRSTIEIAASWLAAGLDPEHVTFYRQSDIPEIPELCWLLTCVKIGRASCRERV